MGWRFLSGASETPAHLRGVCPSGFRAPASTLALNPASQQWGIPFHVHDTDSCGCRPLVSTGSSAGCCWDLKGLGPTGTQSPGSRWFRHRAAVGCGQLARPEEGAVESWRLLHRLVSPPLSPCVSPSDAASTLPSPSRAHFQPSRHPSWGSRALPVGRCNPPPLVMGQGCGRGLLRSYSFSKQVGGGGGPQGPLDRPPS